MPDNDYPAEGFEPPERPNTRPELNRAARRQAARSTPLDDKKAQEMAGGLASLFGKSKPKVHAPILKSLETIGVEPRVLDVMIGDESVECFVIPTQELIFKEWRHMTGANFTSSVLGEGSNED